MGYTEDVAEETIEYSTDKIQVELFEDRKIILNGDVTNDIIYTIFHNMELMKKDSKKSPIHLYINSSGGDITTAFFVISYILSSTTPVYTYCMGMAGSAAAFLLVSGHKRFAYKYSNVMLHLVRMEGEVSTKRKDLMAQGHGLKLLDDSIYDLLVSKTNMTKHKLRNKMETDWYISAKEALKYGIIDDIL